MPIVTLFEGPWPLLVTGDNNVCMDYGAEVGAAVRWRAANNMKTCHDSPAVNI